MEITGTINSITYSVQCAEKLRTIAFDTFDINTSPPACVVTSGGTGLALSKWVSPKRTRSYPYERVYNTLQYPMRVTVIPVLKDEGARGERDFLQWDTVMLMSLLDVHVILGYYNQATARGNKVSNFMFDAVHVGKQLKELLSSKPQAREWNIAQLQQLQSGLLERVVEGYNTIAQQTGVAFHDNAGIEQFRRSMHDNLETFMEFSRKKSVQAQNREFNTIQPKEALSSATKAKVTIHDAWGGLYYFTVDEVAIENNTLYMIEDKHTVHGVIPNISDIKDGLLKMIFYRNMTGVAADGIPMNHIPTVALTSRRLVTSITTADNSANIVQFVAKNNLKPAQQQLIEHLFKEAQTNGIEIRLHHAE